ncbi:uncharacterized [Tachysurus ichikawai]
MLTVPIESSPAEVKLLAPSPGGALVTSASISPHGCPACQFFHSTINSSMPMSPLPDLLFVPIHFADVDEHIRGGWRYWYPVSTL